VIQQAAAPNGGPIEFHVLGPTGARCNGESLPIGGARRRALVARLLLDADRVVPPDTLIDDVWDGHAKEAAAATLQSHISQLRKVLGVCLQTRSGGYALSLAGATLDAHEFEHAAGAGTAELAAGDYDSAIATFTRAVGLWQGPAFQDVADRVWVQPEATRLEELRACCVEQLLRARLQAGEHQQVVADAEAAVAEQALREERWAILALALYRSGRQADALGAFSRLRHLLGDQLGIDPSPPLVALEASVRRQDPSLDSPSRASRPVSGVNAGLVRSGRAAAAQYDWPSAFEHLVAADRAKPLDAADLELLGDVAFMAGDQHTSISARQRAHVLWLGASDPIRAAVDALLIVGNYYVRNRPAIAAGWYQKGRRLLEDQPLGSAHGVLSYSGALIALTEGRFEAAATAAAEALRIGTSCNDRDVETIGLTLHGCALARLGHLDQALPLLDEALATASTGALGPISTGQIFCWSTQALLTVGDYPRAAEWIETIEACGVGGIPGDCRLHRAEVLRALGRLDQAETEADTALKEIQAVDLLHVGIAHYELAMIHLTRGDLQNAERSLDQAAACGAAVEPGRALLRLARGDPAAASTIDAALADSGVDPVHSVATTTKAHSDHEQ
jgi:DNA-binding SARP family transcriptional activator